MSGEWKSKWKEEWLLFDKDKERKVATITLNRPEALNAMTQAMYENMKQIIVGIDTDEDVKVVVIKGAGRAFCSGFDVGELGYIHGQSSGENKKQRRPSQRARLLVDETHWGHDSMYDAVFRSKKATIAQVHQYCYGAGYEIALACDMTVAAEGTLFTHPGYRYIGPAGWIGYLIEVIGVKKAKQMMLTGTPIDAKEAHRIGMINEVAPLEELEEATNKLVDEVLRLPFDGIVIGKAHFEAALDALGVATGNSLAYICHALQTNIQYGPGEFNLFKERREKGIKGAILTREAHYKEDIPPAE